MLDIRGMSGKTGAGVPVKVLYEFIAADEAELSVKQGEIMISTTPLTDEWVNVVDPNDLSRKG